LGHHFIAPALPYRVAPTARLTCLLGLEAPRLEEHISRAPVDSERAPG